MKDILKLLSILIATIAIAIVIFYLLGKTAFLSVWR
jgi:hypothetical protein